MLYTADFNSFPSTCSATTVLQRDRPQKWQQNFLPVWQKIPLNLDELYQHRGRSSSNKVSWQIPFQSKIHRYGRRACIGKGINERNPSTWTKQKSLLLCFCMCSIFKSKLIQKSSIFVKCVKMSVEVCRSCQIWGPQRDTTSGAQLWPVMRLECILSRQMHKYACTIHVYK